MDTLQLVLLSVIQGLTEFLPVSSSAHLVLLSEFLRQEDQGIIFDVGVHFGTLIAAIVYFRSDIKTMLINLISEKLSSPGNNLTFNLAVAVFPILIAGFFLRDSIDLKLRNSEVIAYATILFGLLLYLAQLNKGKQEFATTGFQREEPLVKLDYNQPKLDLVEKDSVLENTPMYMRKQMETVEEISESSEPVTVDASDDMLMFSDDLEVPAFIRNRNQ